MSKNQTNSLLELLYRVSREVATALDLRTVLQRVLYAAIDNVGGERGSIVVMDDHGKPIDSVIVYGRRIHGDTTQQLRVTVERGLAGWVVRNRKATLVPDTSQDERWLRRPDDAVQQSGAKAAICVPLLAREKIVGVLTLVHSLPNAFNESHLQLIQAIADQAGVAVLNARLYTESQRQARVMTALADGAVTINASLQMQDVFQRILNQTIQALQVETVALALEEKESGDFVFRAATGKDAGSLVDRRVFAGQGLIGKVVKDRRGVVVPAIKKFNTLERNAFDGIDSKAVAMAPIQAQGKIIGVLEAINPVSGVFDPDALLVMTGIGSLAGSTIQNAQLFERVEKMQQRYYELFNDSIDPILISDLQGNILEANRQALALGGYSPEDFRQLNINALHVDGEDVFDLDVGSLEDYQLHKYESLLQTQSGEKIPIEVYVRSIYLEKGEALQWTFRDITERKELDRLRDDMASMIYHDLRSPLSNILSSLSMMSVTEDESGDESDKALVRIAQNSAERIQRLISSLLDINRLEAGQDILKQESVSPLELVEQAIEAVEPRVKSRQQILSVNIDKNLPRAFADADMLRRVLINLLENASKFTPLEGAIQVSAVQENERMLRFGVADNGIGITPENRQYIFKKFARVQNTENVSGLGVGLAFCRLAVSAHGGQIWVAEENPHGTRFNLTIPISTKEEEND